MSMPERNDRRPLLRWIVVLVVVVLALLVARAIYYAFTTTIPTCAGCCNECKLKVDRTLAARASGTILQMNRSQGSYFKAGLIVIPGPPEVPFNTVPTFNQPFSLDLPAPLQQMPTEAHVCMWYKPTGTIFSICESVPLDVTQVEIMNLQ